MDLDSVTFSSIRRVLAEILAFLIHLGQKGSDAELRMQYGLSDAISGGQALRRGDKKESKQAILSHESLLRHEWHAQRRTRGSPIKVIRCDGPFLCWHSFSVADGFISSARDALRNEYILRQGPIALQGALKHRKTATGDRSTHSRGDRCFGQEQSSCVGSFASSRT